MEAGRELDALVTEKVMGWQWFKMDTQGLAVGIDHPWANTRSLRPDKSNGVWTLVASLDLPMHFDNRCIPHYSTNIAAAWLVVENLNKREWRVEIAHTVNSGVDVVIAKWEEGHFGGEFAEWAETAPLAICRAALKAVGGA